MTRPARAGCLLFLCPPFLYLSRSLYDYAEL